MKNTTEAKNLKNKLVEMRLKNQLGDLKETSEIRKLRRSIARLLSEANKSGAKNG